MNRRELDVAKYAIRHTMFVLGARPTRPRPGKAMSVGDTHIIRRAIHDQIAKYTTKGV